MTVRVHVAAAGATSEGRLRVRDQPFPYNMFNVPAEATPPAPTAAANLSFAALAGFPVEPERRLLVMFVRCSARTAKNLLAGTLSPTVSSRSRSQRAEPEQLDAGAATTKVPWAGGALGDLRSHDAVVDWGEPDARAPAEVLLPPKSPVDLHLACPGGE